MADKQLSYKAAQIDANLAKASTAVQPDELNAGVVSFDKTKTDYPANTVGKELADLATKVGEIQDLVEGNYTATDTESANYFNS